VSAFENNDGVPLTLWDFAGQQVFYSLHHIFLSDNAIYLLCFDIQQFLQNTDSEIQIIKFWIRSLLLNAKNAPLLIVGTHCEPKSVTHEDFLETSAKLKTVIAEFKEVRLICNEGLYFFPVANNLKAKNERYLNPIKKQIGDILSGNQNAIELSSFNSQVKSSWVFLMDILLAENQPQLQLARVIEIGEEYGMNAKSIEEALNFYHETGTIVYFGNSMMVDEDRNDCNFVIINPQWLLDCLGCFMYDVKFHGSKETKIDTLYMEDVQQLEKSGLMSRKLFNKLLSSLTEEEKYFIETLCMNKKLMSKFIFNTNKEGENLFLDSDKFLIPVMIKDEEDEIIVPKGHKIELQLNEVLPIGLFETVICSFVEKSGQIEGSKDPELFKNAAIIWFGNEMKIKLFLSQEDVIMVRLSERDLFKHDILKTCKEVAISIEDRFKYGLKVTIDSTIPNYMTHLGNRLKQFIGYKPQVEEEEKIILKNLNHAQDNKAKKSTKIKYDCFLAHDWGSNANGNKTHQRVKNIRNMLKKKGMNVWFDEDKLQNDISAEVTQGVDESKKVIIFITRRYIERVKDVRNNCTKEFKYVAKKKKFSNIIPVVFEEGLWDMKTWEGPVLYELQDKLYIDMSSDEMVEKNFDLLCKRIKS